jgi:ABC-type methionine transport system permease subunit
MILEVKYLLFLFSGMFVMILGLVICSHIFYNEEDESTKEKREEFILSNITSKVR